MDFSVTYSFRPYHGPGVDSAPSENEYQEHFLGVKAVGAWGWQPHHLHVPNVMEIWEPNPPGTLWATPGLLRDCFTFFWKAFKGCYFPDKYHCVIFISTTTTTNQFRLSTVNTVSRLQSACIGTSTIWQPTPAHNFKFGLRQTQHQGNRPRID